jgi:hypothetical protein
LGFVHACPHDVSFETVEVVHDEAFAASLSWLSMQMFAALLVIICLEGRTTNWAMLGLLRIVVSGKGKHASPANNCGGQNGFWWSTTLPMQTPASNLRSWHHCSFFPVVWLRVHGNSGIRVRFAERMHICLIVQCIDVWQHSPFRNWHALIVWIIHPQHGAPYIWCQRLIWPCQQNIKSLIGVQKVTLAVCKSTHRGGESK